MFDFLRKKNDQTKTVNVVSNDPDATYKVKDVVENPYRHHTVNGYKGTDKDMKCRDYQFELNSIHYSQHRKMCSSGFHFCKDAANVQRYYDIRDEKMGNRLFEVAAYGDIESDGDKSVTSMITFLREIPRVEALRLLGDKVEVVNGHIVRHEYRITPDDADTNLLEYGYDAQSRKIWEKVSRVYGNGSQPSVMGEKTWLYEDDRNLVSTTEYTLSFPYGSTHSPGLIVVISNIDTGNELSTHGYYVDANREYETLVYKRFIEYTEKETIISETTENGAVNVTTVDKVTGSRTKNHKFVQNGLEIMTTVVNNQWKAASIPEFGLAIELERCNFNERDFIHSNKILHYVTETRNSYDYDYRGRATPRTRSDSVLKGAFKITFNGKTYDNHEFYKDFLTEYFGFDFTLANHDLPYYNSFNTMVARLVAIKDTGIIPDVNELHERFWSMGLINPVGYDYATVTRKGMAVITLLELMQGA